MKNASKGNGRKRRAPRGAGRLYKRDNQGVEHPADWNGVGSYWLAYRIPKEGGTTARIRQPLRDAADNPITDRDQAEAERKRIMAPYQTGNHVETLKAVQARLTDAVTNHKQAVEDANPPLLIADTWQEYVKSLNRPRSGAATLHRYELHWERFTNWIGTVYPTVKYLCDITRKIGTAYGHDLDKAGYNPNTFNKHVRFMALLFAVLAKHENARIEMNPFGKDEIKRRDLETHSRRELTIQELITVLEKSDGELELLLNIGAATGLRLGDCCNLTWNHIDLVQRLIQLAPRKTARRHPNGTVKLGIPPRLFDMLATRQPVGRAGYVLPTMAARYASDPSLVTNRVKAHLLECGIDVHAPGTGEQIKRKSDGTPERNEKTGEVITETTGNPAVVEVGFHSLRHTWVSMHAAHGTPGAIVQASVGHANPAMTAHYTHISDDTARKTALALPVFGGRDSPTREPLPQWARELLATLTPRNAKTIKAELLKEGAA